MAKVMRKCVICGGDYSYCPRCGEGLKEGVYDVSDAEFKAMLKDKTFQEFGEALNEEKVEQVIKAMTE